MDVCSQLRGRGVGDSRANGNPQEFGEPGDDGKGLRAFRAARISLFFRLKSGSSERGAVGACCASLG